MSRTTDLPRPEDSPCMKCAGSCTSITVGKGEGRKTFPGCATWQKWFSARWTEYQKEAERMKYTRELKAIAAAEKTNDQGRVEEGS